MAEVVMYWKPGCCGNARQLAALEAAGHQVETRDLRSHGLTPLELRAFFGDLPVRDWINRSSPRVKRGEVVPELLVESTAMALFLEDPLLIRRPLLRVGRMLLTGFERDRVEALVGPLPVDANLEGCARGERAERCADGK